MSKLRIHFVAIHFEARAFMVEEDMEDMDKLPEGNIIINLYNKVKENNLKTEL